MNSLLCTVYCVGNAIEVSHLLSTIGKNLVCFAQLYYRPDSESGFQTTLRESGFETTVFAGV